MIIKINRKRNELDPGKSHELSASRREFLKKGILSTSAIVAMPAAMRLMVKEALADETCVLTGLQGADTPSFMALELEGGAGLTRAFYPSDMGGQPLNIADTNMLGIRRADGINSTLIRGLNLNQTDAFENFLRNPSLTMTINNTRIDGVSTVFGVAPALHQQAMALTSGTVLYAQTGDDTSSNPNSALKLVSAIQNNRASAGRLRAQQFDNSLTPPGFVNATSVNQLTQAVGLPYADSTMQKIEAARKAAATISNTRRSALSRMLAGTMALDRHLCGQLNNVVFGDPNVGNAVFNPDSFPANDPIKQTFTNLANLNANQKFLVALCTSAARGYYFGQYRIDGCDYHDNTATSAQIIHARMAAEFVSVWAAVHQALGKKGLLYIFTDGGINWSGDANRVAVGDRGAASVGVLLTINGGGSSPIPMVGNIGYMDPTNQTSARSTVIGGGTNGVRAAISAGVTYAQLCGIPLDAVNAYTSSIVGAQQLSALKGIAG